MSSSFGDSIAKYSSKAEDRPLISGSERTFEVESKYSLSSLASTRLPLSTFSGPTVSGGQRPTSLIQADSFPDSSGIFKGTSAGVLSSPSVNTQSYPPKARSNFVLGPTKSVIFANNNDSNMQKAKYQSSVCSNPSTYYNNLPLKPPDNPYAPNFQPFTTFADTTKGVDENIYHWKVLNLSRAKLKASSRTSALLSGFAMVAMVEIQIDDKVPQPLLITFAACTVLLIAVHMLALMISTCILPNVEAVANLHFQTSKTVFESPHMKMGAIVELAWGFSTVIGILLFLVEIAILCWVKFYNVSPNAAWTATGLLIPIMAVFIAFAAHFYLKLVSHKSEVYEDGIKELELLKGQLSTAEEGQAETDNDQASNSAVQVV
eukprot:07461.XXX_377610_375956_1 [CDS] Oithona nana genome sequencing.